MSATCASCSTLALGWGPPSEQTLPAAWTPASRTPQLGGSTFVGRRGVAGLFICRDCGSLWQIYAVPREDCSGARRIGREAVALFAADSDLERLVRYVATRYEAERFGCIFDLAKMLVRRRPVGLQAGVDRLFSELGGVGLGAAGAEVDRISMLFRILRLALERAARGDLRPPGPRARKPLRFPDRLYRAEYERFEPRSERGLVYLACNREALGWRLWEGCMSWGAANPEEAVLALSDLAPLWRLLDRPPFETIASGTLRGVHLDTWWRGIDAFLNPCALAWNDHALFLPTDQWQELRRRLDGLSRLGDSAERLLAIRDDSPERALRQVEQELVLLPRLLRRGARFLPETVDRLLAIRDDLSRKGRGMSDEEESARLAAAALDDLLSRNRSAVEADGGSSYAWPPRMSNQIEDGGRS